MAATKKRRPAASKSRKPSGGNRGGRFFALLLLAGVSLAGGFALRQSGLYRGQIHHLLSIAHIAIMLRP